MVLKSFTLFACLDLGIKARVLDFLEDLTRGEEFQYNCCEVLTNRVLSLFEKALGEPIRSRSLILPNIEEGRLDFLLRNRVGKCCGLIWVQTLAFVYYISIKPHAFPFGA